MFRAFRTDLTWFSLGRDRKIPGSLSLSFYCVAGDLRRFQLLLLIFRYVTLPLLPLLQSSPGIRWLIFSVAFDSRVIYTGGLSRILSGDTSSVFPVSTFSLPSSYSRPVEEV